MKDLAKKQFEYDLRAEQAKTKAAIRKWKEALAEADQFRKIHRFLDSAQLNNAPAFRITPNNPSGKSESIAVLALTDVHYEEVVRKRSVGGLNQFNPEICETRVSNFARISNQLIQIERHATQIKKAILFLGGDNISGHIHPELVENNSDAPVEASYKVTGVIKGVIQYLLKNSQLEQLVVVCCIGNHGRDTFKMPASTAWKHSYEAWIYWTLSDHYAKDERVQFVMEPSYHQYVEVFGKTIRFSHGEAIRYQGGILGLAVPVSKKIANWNTAKLADFDVMGHLHVYTPGANFLVNGSVIGYGPYSIKIGAPYQAPIQGFLVFEKDRWLTAIRPIYVG